MSDFIIKPEYATLIFQIRGYKVMIDSDLALLYHVATKVLKQQVRRNAKRFPSDFMFELTKLEKNELVTNCDRLTFLKHSSVNPLAFTEQGVAMLSSVIRSAKAIQINIDIMRAFARYRVLFRETEILNKNLKTLDNKLDRSFQFLLEKIDAADKPKRKRRPIGFKQRRGRSQID
jgi:hypothetical protein